MCRPTVLLILLLLTSRSFSAEPPVYQGRTAAMWSQDLAQPSSTVRVAAAKALVALKSAAHPAQNVLLIALRDPNPDVRLHCAHSLGLIVHRPAPRLEALTKLLATDKDEHVRYAAEWSLARIAVAISKGAPDPDDAQRIEELLAGAERALEAHAQRKFHFEQFRQARQQFTQAVNKAAAKAAEQNEPAQDEPAPDEPAPAQTPQPQSPPPAARREPAAGAASGLELERGLRADDKLVQLKAVESLRKLGQADRLIQAWEHADEGGFLFWHISHAVVRMGSASVPTLAGALRHHREAIRFQAAHCLKQIGPEAGAALPTLLALIQDPTTTDDMRSSAILVIAGIGPRAAPATAALAQLLQPQQPDTILAAAAEALAAIGPTADLAVPRLLELVRDVELWADTRIAAARAAAQIDPDSEPALQTILPLLDEQDAFLAAGIADVVGDFGSTAAVAAPRLLQLLETIPDEHRQTVISALGRLGESAKSASSRLIDVLADPAEDQSVQVAAAEALAQIGEDAVRSLAVLLDHPELVVRQTAGRALVEIRGRAVPVVADLLRKFQQTHEHEEVRALTAIALGQIGETAAVALPALTAAVRDQNQPEYVRSMSAVAVGQIDAAAAPVLLAALDDASSQLQVAAAYALQRMPVPHSRALPALFLALEDESSRPLAVRALADLGDAYLPQLAGLVSDTFKDVEVRLAGLEILGRLGAGADILARALNDEALSEVAYWTLRDLGNAAIPQLLAATENESALSSDAESDIRELIEEFYEGVGGDGGSVTWSAGHALVARPNKKRGRGATAAPRLELPPVNTSAAPMMLSEPAAAAAAGGQPVPSASSDERAAPARELSDDHEPPATVELGAPTPATPPDVGPNSEPDAEWPEASLAPDRGELEAMRTAPPDETSESGVGGNGSPGSTDAAPGLDGASDAASESSAVPPAHGGRTVKVFYGTNRQPIAGIAGGRPWTRQLWLPLTVPLLVGIVGSVIFLLRRRLSRIAPVATGGAALMVLGTLGIAALNSGDWLQIGLASPAISYGGQYSDRLEMGICEVSIPEGHQEGKLESPSLLRLQFKADPLKHIVLKSIQRLDRDDFFSDLDRELQVRGRSILVFVHGYNVSFEDAARRTAQMAFDLRFAGAPMFYSWPSQANWRKYRVDEKNVELSIDSLKAFLTEIALRSQAHTINLIAHSMGNRALTQALKEIEVSSAEQSQWFNQVILAAPDIDADIFKQRIAPAIVGKARNITLYASSNDLALVASQEFNSGDPRAGDAGPDLVLIPGIETIDVSAGDTSLLGHSYYGSSTSVLRDIELLLQNRPPAARRFLMPQQHQGVTYWRFQPATASLRGLGTPR